MNETTLFLSQLMGPVLIALGLSMLIRKDAYQEFFQNLSKNRAFLLYNGLLEGTAGLAIVLHHNLWNTPAQVVISLLGWGMMLEGLFGLFVSKRTIKDIVHSSATTLNVAALLCILMGAYLAYVAYFI